ncbi:MAG: helix-turn-helix transcriptional regulator [Muribaculaceae bacterium]|nr:helix-turn-helix transcriptional regulator [Muribaculaceae bacterium]
MIENRFAKLLGERRLDRRDIVKMTGLNNHIVLNIYKGEYKRIDVATLDKLCSALECDTNDIFKYIPDK